MGSPVCRINDEGDHGGVITTGSPDTYATAGWHGSAIRSNA